MIMTALYLRVISVCWLLFVSQLCKVTRILMLLSESAVLAHVAVGVHVSKLTECVNIICSECMCVCACVRLRE